MITEEQPKSQMKNLINKCVDRFLQYLDGKEEALNWWKPEDKY